MASSNKADYEEVPDVEDRVIPLPEVDPRETYPEADELQARLLGDLDEVIKLPNPKVELPRIQAQQVAGAPTTWSELLEALKIPTQTFVATVTVAILTIIWGSSLVQQLFPYVACIIEFASTVPALVQRFANQSDRVFETLDEVDGTIDAQVDAVTFKVQFCVDSVQDLTRQVVEPVRPKLEKVRQAEVILQKYDETIDIPDPDDIEKELDGCGDAVQEKMDAVKRSIDFRKCIPVFLRSKENFTWYILYPILIVFLGLQLYGVYQSSQMQDEAATNQATTRYLRGSIVEQELDVMVEDVRSSTTGETTDEVSWYPLWVALQVYLTAVVEIFIGFLMSQASMIAATLNVAIGRVENEANGAIDTTGAAEVFETYLTTKMQVLRMKLLKLVETMIKIDNVQRRIAGSSSLAGAEKLADSAKEKIEKVKQQQGFPFNLPWSPFGKKK